MTQSAIYIGGQCPPNIEAYLDSLLYRTASDGRRFDIVVTTDCELPTWLRDTNRLSVVAYDAPSTSGLGVARTTARVMRRYLGDYAPNRVRQITQPRWHAPGVLVGTLGTSVETCTRASASLFAEFREAPSPIRAWMANNAIGRSIFMADRVYTPKYGGIKPPWWAPAECVIETRVINEDRFSPEAKPRDGLFRKDQQRVLTVGRISRRKGTDLLIEVADHLENHEFVVVGPIGDESLAAAANAAPNVTHHPPVDYVEMPGLYAAADLVLSTSRLEWGGVSRAMLEGKAIGRLVVAIDREYASEVADEAVPADPERIAAAVKRNTQ